MMARSGGNVDQHQLPRRYLRDVPLLASLNKKDMDWAQGRFQRRQYRADETILRPVREGFLGLVEQGEVVVISQTYGTQGRSATLRPGDHFSTLSDHGRETNSATMRAVTPAVLWFLSQADWAEVARRQASSGIKYSGGSAGSEIAPGIKRWRPHLVRFGLVLVVILLAWTIFASSWGQSFRADLRFALGARYLQRGQLDAAMQQFQAAIRTDPRHAASYEGLGRIYFQQARWEQALATLDRAASLDPASDVIQNNLGVLRSRQGDVMGAFESLRQAADLGGNVFQVYVNLGNQYLASGDWLNAGRAFREGLRLNPNLPMTRYNLGVAYYRLQRYTDAQEEFERALQLEPDLAPAHVGLGILAFEQDRLSVAQLGFQHAVELNPQDAVAHFYLGLVRGRMDQPLAATEAFKSALYLTSDPAIQQQAMWHLKQLRELP